MKTIAWLLMIESDDSLTREQAYFLLEKIPKGAKIVPYVSDGIALESNSIAMGFILDEAEEAGYGNAVLETVAPSLNDWDKLRMDCTYKLNESLCVEMYDSSEYEVNTPALSTSTPKGEICAIVATNPDYPGIYVDANGRQAALIEYDGLLKELVVRVWDPSRRKEDDEPVFEVTLNGEWPEEEEEEL